MPRKNKSTPIKPSEGSTMTHEDEELQHDLSKLQEEVQQISLSQRATKNEMEVLKKGVEAKMDSMEANMESKMDSIKDNVENMKENMKNMKNDLKADIEGLTKLIQEMFPNGEKIVEEPHDENKINVNRDFINPNVGGKNHHIQKMDMRKFDGKDPVTWIL